MFRGKRHGFGQRILDRDEFHLGFPDNTGHFDCALLISGSDSDIDLEINVFQCVHVLEEHVHLLSHGFQREEGDFVFFLGVGSHINGIRAIDKHTGILVLHFPGNSESLILRQRVLH